MRGVSYGSTISNGLSGRSEKTRATSWARARIFQRGERGGIVESGERRLAYQGSFSCSLTGSASCWDNAHADLEIQCSFSSRDPASHRRRVEDHPWHGRRGLLTSPEVLSTIRFGTAVETRDVRAADATPTCGEHDILRFGVNCLYTSS